ncbi:hypothetical protein [Photorhabdus sp. CRCIA-P01]|nr:hypothetical protein [Photorhabdus sp. CRCIA-P01]
MTITGSCLFNSAVNLTLLFEIKKTSKGKLDDIEAGFLPVGMTC